ncbi:S-adenosylhomocysteine deaminase [Halobacteriales archaeon QS_1_68_20]|nr:MAG: S-adenosylhomocysteine deaminase [Halobacteriales archaeon QS_1_68_20]
MMTLAIQGGRVLRPDMTVARADVLVEDGRIEAIEEGIDADQTLDAEGSLVMPGLVNPHCHVPMSLLRSNADDMQLGPWLREAIWPVEAELTAEDVRSGSELGLVEMIKNGITTFADMYFFVPEVARAVDDAGMRGLLGYGIITEGKDDEESREEVREGIEFAREYDGFADGRVRTAVMPHSLTTVEPWALEETAEAADEMGVPLHFHANETRNEVDPIVEERGKRPLEWAEELGMLDGESFVAHGVHCDETEIELLAETDTGVGHCPASNMKLNSGIAPVQDMLDAGVDVGVATDGPASNNDLDQFDELRDAAMIGKLGADDPTAVSAASAVEMATWRAADVLGMDVGRLEEGAPADLAVVDFEKPHLTPQHDLVSLLAYAVRGGDVRHTVCDGTVLMANREVLTLDEDRVRREATERAQDLLERAE